MFLDKIRKNVIWQVAILFIVGIIAIGLISFFSQQVVSVSSVRTQAEKVGASVTEEVKMAVHEYPAFEWLLQYWYENADSMDIEYDVDYSAGTETEKKANQLEKKYPDLQLKYATAKDIYAMSEEDQKTYAEVTYSWLITRINQIKKSYDLAFLYCAVTTGTYDTQFFLMSAGENGGERGTEYGQIYPIGKKVKVRQSLHDAMLSAKQNSSYFAEAGDYVDYYSYLGMINNDIALIGMTYDLKGIKEDISEKTFNGTLFAIINQLLLSAVCMLLIYQVILTPLKRVQENIRLYRETKESETIKKNLADIKSQNEIGQLSRDVVELTEEIDHHVERIETITSERERISTELNLATRIQQSMVPSGENAFPDRSDFAINATMEPAREVSGDFYDFYMVDDDHLCMIMADVAGKGVPAALFMMASKIVLKNNAMAGKSPAQILTDSNNGICANNQQEMFVTVWVGVLELSTGKLTAANAGHEYPMISNADGEFEVYNDKHGFVIGGMPGIKYGEYEIQLEPGSRIFVYTDGIPEATDGNGEMFGMDSLLAALNKDTEAEPSDVIRNVRSAVADFVEDAEQFDDLTMMCVEYKGNRG